MGYEIGMDEGHDCQVHFKFFTHAKRYTLVDPEHKHVFPLYIHIHMCIFKGRLSLIDSDFAQFGVT